MRVQWIEKKWKLTTPLEEPAWASKVPRWYQLDGEAFALTETLFQHPVEFDHLLLASPEASNSTDWSFVQTGASRAQKFVHTLPNIRASMALQALDKVVRFTCIQKGPETLSAALEEFYDLSLANHKVALASVEPLSIDDRSQKRQFYRVTIVVKSPSGNGRVVKPQKGSEPSLWTLEKISEA